jgi:toxin YhaV
MKPRRQKPPTEEIAPPILEINGWKIFAHPLFLQQFEALLVEVEQLQAKDPTGYRERKKTKLLAAILKMVVEVIPQNPVDPKFRQGNTLGPSYRHWQRAKFFDGRFRLFFRYSSDPKVIIMAWVNDSETLRTYGSKTDAYAVFKKMLEKDQPPDDWNKLKSEAAKATPQGKSLITRGKQRNS